MSTEDLSSLSCSIKLFFKIIIIYFVLLYSLCCSLVGTDLLLSITVYIYSALHFASLILRITFFPLEKLFICMIATAHYCGLPSCHMTVSMVLCGEKLFCFEIPRILFTLALKYLQYLKF